MFKAFGWDVIWCDSVEGAPLRVFGPYATLERAAYAVRELGRWAANKRGTFTVVEVEA